MKIFDPKRHLPVGWEWERTKDGLRWGHFFSTWTILGFLRRYIDARDALYTHIQKPGGLLIRELDPKRTIAPFWELMRGMPLFGLWIFLAVMPMLVWRFYSCHTQGAMSVYTMRRLPDPMEYHRRCWTQPILSAVTELVLFAVLIGLCWLLWQFATPEACLPH